MPVAVLITVAKLRRPRKRAKHICRAGQHAFKSNYLCKEEENTSVLVLHL